MATKKEADTMKEKGVLEQTVAAQETDPWAEKRSIKIPRLQNSKHQPDMAVSVNGRIFKIQRGVEVEVPLPIWEVAMRSIQASEDAQDAYFAAAGIKHQGEI